MSPDILKLVFIAIAVFVIYKLLFSGKFGLTLFEMHFKDGKLISHKGKIPEKFSRECRAIAKSNKLTCTVKAHRKGDVRLHVSASVGDNITQRIRNVFPFEYYDKKRPDNNRKAS